MKTKFLLPMLAFIFAIGMAFATAEPKPEAKIQSDYVHLGNNNWQEIPEQDCQGIAQTCKVRFGVGGPVYDVYDEMSLTTLKLAPTDHQPAIIN